MSFTDDAWQGERRPAAPGAGSCGSSPRWHTAPPPGGRPLPTSRSPGAGGERPPSREEEEEAPRRVSSRTGPRSNPATSPPRPLPRRPPPARPPAAVPYLGSHAVPGAATPSRPFPSSAPLPSDRGAQLPRLRTSPPAPAVTARSHRQGRGAAPARPRRGPVIAGTARTGPVIARHGPDRPRGLRAARRARRREMRPRAPALRGELRLTAVKGPAALLAPPRWWHSGCTGTPSSWGSRSLPGRWSRRTPGRAAKDANTFTSNPAVLPSANFFPSGQAVGRMFHPVAASPAIMLGCAKNELCLRPNFVSAVLVSKSA